MNVSVEVLMNRARSNQGIPDRRREEILALGQR